MILRGEVCVFIHAQRVARLATVDDAGRPHAVPICFALQGDTLYTAIDGKPKSGDYHRLRRIRNVAANPQVQVLFDAYDDTGWSLLRYVQLRGRARIIEHGAEHAAAVGLLRARYPQYRPGGGYGGGMESRPVIAVDAERIVEWSAS
jgi:PPOX class probable F420-dependent enzyme